jgi:hypothetical protein
VEVVLLTVIAGCEIGFWVLLAAGMVTRYLLRRPKAGLVLLAGVPLVDVVMLVAGVMDLHNGAAPSYKHSLAAIFIGCSVGFGHQTIAWADRWAAHLLAGAPRPAKPPKGGRARAIRERQGWYRHLLAWAIGSGLMLLGTLLSGGLEKSGVLLQPAVTWTIVLVIDGFVSFSYSLDGKSEHKQSV